MTNHLKEQSIRAKGYGILPKAVMKDRRLSIEAKAIYGYLATYAGNGTTAFPSVRLLLLDLGISKNRFYTHRKQLIDLGYLSISQQKRANGGFSSNEYTLLQTVPTTETQSSVSLQKRHGKTTPLQNKATNNKQALEKEQINSLQTTTELNSVLALCTKHIQQPITAEVKQLIQNDMKTYGLQAIEEAFVSSAHQVKHSYRYISALLNNQQSTLTPAVAVDPALFASSYQFPWDSERGE